MGLFLVVVGIVFFWQLLVGWPGPQCYLWDDFLEHSYPRRFFAATSLAQGEIPFWNPHVFAGMPFLADIESAIFYPLNAALTLFVADGSISLRAVEAVAVANLILAGIWMFLLARQLGVSPWGAGVSGVTFMLSGFLVTHLIHLPIIEVAVWLPLGFLFFHLAFKKTSILHALLGGAVLAVAFLGGSPQIVLIIYLGLGLFTLYAAGERVGRDRVFSPTWLRIPLLAALAVAFSLGLSAFQLLPSLELSQLSVRPQLTYEQSVECSFPLKNLLTFFMPHFFGGTTGGNFGVYWGGAWYYYFWEMCGYVGVIGLLLAWIGLWKSGRPHRVFFGLLAVAGILMAAGKYGGIHWLLFHGLPGYDRFRIPSRALLLFGFAASVLAGYGTEVLMDRKRGALGSWLRTFAWIWGLVAAGVFLAGVLLFWKTGFGGRLAVGTPLDWGYFAARAAPFAVLAAAGGVLVELAAREKIPRLATGMAVMGLVVVDLFVFGYHHNLGEIPPDRYYLSGDLVEMLKPVEDGPLFRVQTRGNGGAVLIRRNQGMINGVFNIDGYNQLKLSSYETFDVGRDRKLDLLNTRYRVEPAGERGRFQVVESRGYLPRVWVAPDVVQASDGDNALEIIKREDFDPRRTLVLEEPWEWPMEGQPASGRAQADIISYGSNRIEVEASLDGRGFLVFSEIHYPDWVAYVDRVKQPVLRADYALRAVPLEEGTHRVVMAFESGRFRTGLLVSGLCLLGGLGVVIARGLGVKV